jgi:hypothetical protein
MRDEKDGCLPVNSLVVGIGNVCFCDVMLFVPGEVVNRCAVVDSKRMVCEDKWQSAGKQNGLLSCRVVSLLRIFVRFRK